MRRITERKKFEAILNKPEVFHFGYRYGEAHFETMRQYEEYVQIIDRLADYEDTGLEPEEILSGLELAKVYAALEKLKNYEDAEEQGRLLILPCKVGDNVFALADVCLCPIDERCCGDCTGAGCRYASCEVRERKTDSIIQIIRLTEKIGKTVFLTRELAEEALNEQKKL